MTLSRRVAILGLLFAAAVPTTAPAAGAAVSPPSAAAPALSSDDARDVARIVDYLQGLTSAKSRFTQTDARGAQSQGTFYLQRPGRARFEYDPPSGLVIASDGRNVTVVDRRLKTKHVYPLGSTPLALFLARNIRLDRGVVVRQVVHDGGSVTVVAEDAKGKAKGQISLTFSETPLALAGWAVKDARGGVVRVRLAGLAHASPHDPSYFELPNPRTTPDPDSSR
ncbi:MAG TPA: outer-membrane lipoprotein carrier protein LolA [Caulobacteraceae bacterium]|nr:outer-membrane lipoprotein carrier protein LolA [Caulobacteraceae bacterium]